MFRLKTGKNSGGPDFSHNLFEVSGDKPKSRMLLLALAGFLGRARAGEHRRSFGGPASLPCVAFWPGDPAGRGSYIPTGWPRPPDPGEMDALRGRVASHRRGAVMETGPIALWNSTRCGPGQQAVTKFGRWDHLQKCTGCDWQRAADRAVRELPIRVGLVRQPLVDDGLLSSACNVSRVLGRPVEPPRVVLEMDRPWEMERFGGWSYGNVLRLTNGSWFMFYKPFRWGTGLAVSSDGLSWHKPVLGLVANLTLSPSSLGQSAHDWPADRVIRVPAAGSNLLPVGLGRHLGDVLVPSVGPDGRLVAGLQCVHQPTWIKSEWPRSREYLAGWLDVCAGRSPDSGLSWESVASGARIDRLRDEQLTAPYAEPMVQPSRAAIPRSPEAILPGPADSYVQLVHTTSEWLVSTRRNFASADPFSGLKWRGARGLRVMGKRGALGSGGWQLRAEVQLDMEFGPHELHRRQLYGLTSTKYHEVRLGLLPVLQWPRWRQGDRLELFLGTSRDSVHYDLRWVYQNKPLLSEPDACLLQLAQIVTARKMHWLYFHSRPGRHDQGPGPAGSIKLAQFRQDGLAYLQSLPGRTGTVTTKPFELNGPKLLVNWSAAEDGAWLQVEMTDSAGRALPGFERSQCKADPEGVDARVRWGWPVRDLDTLVGQEVRLQFWIRGVNLFAFELSK